ncbi:MAG: HlyD family efflux transporter periplasmic adaptor subunit [Dysgonamonadaceae bacterium]|jgi:HlyD family secretion protein|nr:HlyD family efflux transporter periplasmic adaptor subunit [Dysgonamonadaceae bacterium]
MDRIIEKKKWTPKKIATIVGIAVGVAILTTIFLSTFGKSRLRVEGERMTIAEVKKAGFREFIPVTGTIQPISTIYLDLQEGGRVEEIFVEDGVILKKGQAILRLGNTDLELSLVNQETSVYNLLSQMQIAQNGARQNTISRLNQTVDVESEVVEAKRIYEINEKLLTNNVLAQQDFNESENRYKYLLEKKKLVKEISEQDSLASVEQMKQVEQSYKGAQNGLELMRRKFSDLTVCAPVDGQLTSLDAEIGQSKGKGERIGQIDVLSGFKVRVDVDEHYISRIYPGLEGQYKQGDTTYILVIKKVYTQVSNGRFAVDMMFRGKAPESIRRGQSLQIRIALSDETEALLIPRGGFYQQTGGNWIFKVTKSGDKAYRIPIRIGRQNPDFYEVLEGLEPGEKVVVNSYENYGDIQELIINNWQLTIDN